MTSPRHMPKKEVSFILAVKDMRIIRNTAFGIP